MAADRAMVRLLAWLSPAFPTGGFSYSHGLEYAIKGALVGDAETLSGWVEDILCFGSGAVDAGFVAEAWRAAHDGNTARLLAFADEADARRATAEMALESAQQGEAFLTGVAAGWPDPRLDAVRDALRAAGRPPAASIAVGIATGLAGIPLAAATNGYLQAFAAGLVSAAVRLIPLGQREGLRVLAALEPTILAVAAEARSRPPGDIGGCAWMVDWASVRHETQRTRLFRS